MMLSLIEEADDDHGEVVKGIREEFLSPCEPTLFLYIDGLDRAASEPVLGSLDGYELRSRSGRSPGEDENVLVRKTSLDSYESFASECRRVAGLLDGKLQGWTILGLYEGDRYGTKTYLTEKIHCPL